MLRNKPVVHFAELFYIAGCFEQSDCTSMPNWYLQNEIASNSLQPPPGGKALCKKKRNLETYQNVAPRLRKPLSGMVKALKKILKAVLFLLLIPVAYLLISFTLMWITVNGDRPDPDPFGSVFLTTNGVHLGIVIHEDQMDSLLSAGLKKGPDDRYMSFGWGDENFYLNTPTWSDLTFANAVKALFVKSPTLIHVTRYPNLQNRWVEIPVSKAELEQLNAYILATFALSENGDMTLLEGEGYTMRDDFYKAEGNYTLFKTCNTWVNTGFKQSGLKACYWTPFDFGLMKKYE